MSETYKRFKRYAARLLELQRAGASNHNAPAKIRNQYARAAKRYFGYVKKHPRLASRLNSEMKAAYAGNKNPVRRRGNLVVVSGPHSHAYPARKTRIKKRRRNQGMGVSDLVMTPAYGAFGGAIREGKYVGGPMQWKRRGIGNPRKDKPALPVGTPVRTSKSYERAIGHSMFGTVIGISDNGRFNLVLWGEMPEPVHAVPEALEVDKRHRTRDDYRLAQYLGNKNPLIHGYSRSSFGKNVKRERGRGVGKQRALAIAFSTGRRAAKKAGVRMPKFLRRNPLSPRHHGPMAHFEVKGRHLSHGHYRINDATAGRLARGVGRSLPAWGRELRIVLPSGQEAWLQRASDKYHPSSPKRGWSWVIYGDGLNVKENPRYRQSPPGAPSLAATRATQWRALGTSFPGAIIGPVDARGNPSKSSWRSLGVAKGRIVRWRGEDWRVLGFTSSQVGAGSRRYADFLDVRNARGVRDLIPMDTFLHGGAAVKRNPRRRKNSGEMSFWKATIYSPTGKPIHRQVIRNTRAGALASAKALARMNPKVALDGPYKSAPAC